MEVGVLRRILKKAKRWHVISEDVKMLPERSGIGRALAPEEKARRLEAGSHAPGMAGSPLRRDPGAEYNRQFGKADKPVSC